MEVLDVDLILQEEEIEGKSVKREAVALRSCVKRQLPMNTHSIFSKKARYF